MERDTALSVHNLPFLEALLEQYERDPSSVDPQWIPLLDGGDPGRGKTPSASPARTTPIPADAGAAQIAAQNRIDDLVEAYRLHGHLAAEIDPLERPRSCDTAILDPGHWGVAEGDREGRYFSSELLPGKAGFDDILEHLRRTYCRHVGVEYWALPNIEEREWLRERMEACQNQVVPPPEEQVRLLTKLAHVDTVDNFLHSKFLGAKRFSIAGAESVIALLDCLIEEAASVGVGEVIFGMAHRGRLNVLMNTLGKSPLEVFSEFEHRDPQELLGGGDVKYHLGYHRNYTTSKGRQIYLALAFNPSHLEAITPVISGRVRAKQDRQGKPGQPPAFDASLGVTLHGDAAFAGQGVVAETLNLSQLGGYRTGGTIRVVINNQVGFTTNPFEGRSGLYCTDAAHILQVPVFHVNGDDPEAAAYVARLAVEYRQRFHRDVIIDLVCYRRFGHNEGDDPTFTQPKMYELINARPPVRKQYEDRLIERGTITREDCQRMEEEFHREFDEALEKVRKEGLTPGMSPLHGIWQEYEGGADAECPDADTRTSLEQVERLAPRVTAVPVGFNVHRKIKRLLQEIDGMLAGEAPLSWAAAELLAYATLCDDGHPVRLSGQDAMRGTFSHRHAGLVDSETGQRWYPLQHLHKHQARFDVFNSPLSEFSVLGFEFGYTLMAPYALVIWEAQFGDFANSAQVVIDQFVSSIEDKWNRLSGLVMFLPHGYEGQGPEHSSARLERFLQLCAEDNMQVVNPTTPAQTFHALRRQVLRKWRKPLIVMTPKSLLRYRPSFAPRSELIDGHFHRVIGDAEVEADAVERLLLCSGRVYYDLAAEREERGAKNIAIVRIEQLYPFPAAQLEQILARYPNLHAIDWVQDEPENMGSWTFLRNRLAALADGRFPPRYVGRVESASPATGSPDSHKYENRLILDEAFRDL
jgi:2-oxoglutarate dehydrogenase E1 component